MFRIATLVAVLVACSDDPPAPTDRHAKVTCDDTWQRNGFSDCDLGCKDAQTALTASGPSCAATTEGGISISCQKTFEFDDTVGCCSSDKPAVHFADCNQ